jgi:hypothetical protein
MNLLTIQSGLESISRNMQMSREFEQAIRFRARCSGGASPFDSFSCEDEAGEYAWDAIVESWI